jgi:hypothetical protein
VPREVSRPSASSAPWPAPASSPSRPDPAGGGKVKEQLVVELGNYGTLSFDANAAVDFTNTHLPSGVGYNVALLASSFNGANILIRTGDTITLNRGLSESGGTLTFLATTTSGTITVNGDLALHSNTCKIGGSSTNYVTVNCTNCTVEDANLEFHVGASGVCDKLICNLTSGYFTLGTDAFDQPVLSVVEDSGSVGSYDLIKYFSKNNSVLSDFYAFNWNNGRAATHSLGTGAYNINVPV